MDKPIIAPIASVVPEPPKKYFLKWPLVAIFSFFLGIASVLAYQKYLPAGSNPAAPSPSPLVSPAPSEVERAGDPTTDWQTYFNRKHGYQFKFPKNWIIRAFAGSHEEVESAKSFSLETLESESKAQVATYDWDNSDLKSWLIDHGPDGKSGQGLFPLTEDLEIISDKGQTYAVFNNSIPGWQGKHWSYAIASEKNVVVFVTQDEKNQPEFDLILSTFKFLDAAEPEVPITSLEKIPTISTSNWKNASNNGVRFKIPFEADCNDNQACILVSWTSQYQENTLYHSIRVEVRDYLGGSRREQFYSNIKPECYDVYQEASFGTVRALQIAIDGGWCQGGGGGIIAVIGDKLVIIHNLAYDDKKIINRWDIRDTLVSTLEAI